MSPEDLTNDDLQRIEQCWNNPDSKYTGIFSANYRLENEAVAYFRFQQDLAFVLRNASKARGAALDIGCGTGNLLNALALHYEYCEGIELSDFAYSMARDQTKHLHGTRVRHEDVTTSDINGSFDLIHIGELLMYLNDDAIVRLLQKSTLALSNVGSIIIREPVSASVSFRSQRAGHVALRRSLRHYERLFTTAGLRIVHTQQNVDYNYAWMLDVLLERIAPKFRHDHAVVAALLRSPLIRAMFYGALYVTRLLHKNRFVVHYYFVLVPTTH